MTAIGLLLLIPVVMWIGQTALLRACGMPVRWRIDAGDAPRVVRTGGRVVTQASLVGVLVLYPMMIGESPAAYYRSLFPGDGSIVEFAHGAATAVLFLCALYVVWIATDLVRIDVHQSRGRWVRRLALLPATAVLGALVEEVLFRGVVLADLLRWTAAGPAAAIGAGVFAGAHYVRPVKRTWTIGGHLMLGLLLCVAFLETKRLWLPVGLHAGGIMVIMGMRPFVSYRGPAWVTGASIFPFAGAVGIVGLAVLTSYVASYYGPP